MFCFDRSYSDFSTPGLDVLKVRTGSGCRLYNRISQRGRRGNRRNHDYEGYPTMVPYAFLRGAPQFGILPPEPDKNRQKGGISAASMRIEPPGDNPQKISFCLNLIALAAEQDVDARTEDLVLDLRRLLVAFRPERG